MREVIVTFGAVPEVPAGHTTYRRDDDTLSVHSYKRNVDEWDDPSLIQRYLTRGELVGADVVYVCVGENRQACISRDDSWFLVRRILKDLNGSKKEVVVVTSFEGLNPEVREKEQREAKALGVTLVETRDMMAEEFFAEILLKYR